MAAFSPNTRFLSLVWGFLLLLRNFRACDYIPWLRWWGGLFAPYAYPTLKTFACGCWPCGFSLRPHHWLSLRVCVGPFWGGGAVSSFSPPARHGVGYCCASYWCCFCASSCGACSFPWRVLPQVTLRGLATFLAPFACPAPEVDLCLLGLRCLWYVTWFSTLCSALPPGPAVCAAYPAAGCPWGFLPFLTPSA